MPRHHPGRPGRLGRLRAGWRTVTARLVALRDGVLRALRRLPVGTLLSLLLAVGVFGGFVRVMMTSESHTAPTAGAAPVAPPPSARPASSPSSIPAAPSPRSFASLDGASRWLGVAVWQPTDLPPDLRLESATWYGERPSAAPPGALPRGALVVHYAAADGGVELALVEGAWVFVETTGAPEGQHGVLASADGAPIVWTRGGWVEREGGVADSSDRGAMAWQGVQLSVGSATASGWGWRLSSTTLPLDTMLGVAAAMARHDTIAARADQEITWYLVGTEEEAALLREQLVNGRGGAALLPTEQVIAVETPAEAAAVAEAIMHLDRVQQSTGLPGLRVIDMRTP